jgi:uncharacterized protein YuzE
MKHKWDKENGALYFRLDDSEIYESEEIEPGVIVDFDRTVGIEILRVSTRVALEQVLQFETV